MAKDGTSKGTQSSAVGTPAKTRRAPVAVTSSSVMGAKANAQSAATGVEPKADLTTYPGVMSWLLDRVDVERLRPSRVTGDMLKLERMHALLAELENPHLSVKTVHIAGTKGKGSTCEMTAACLEASGYTVGLYTSPHLVDLRERIRLNRRPVSQADFVRLAQRVDEAVQRLDLRKFSDDGATEEQPTFFELTTAMAFVYFAEQAVDIAVIEVGLGGRLDATNVVRPEVSAVTLISLDHTQILGNTLELIAAEKAGIFKAHVPALTYAQNPAVLEVLQKKAEEAGTSLHVVGRDIEFSHRFENSAPHGPHVRVSLSTARSIYEHLMVPLKGEHQAMNCGLALAILDRLSERGFSCPEARVTEGLASVQLAGRMEMVWKKPRVVADGAHNTDSIKALIKALGAYVPYDSLVMIFGCAADKDFPSMLNEIALGADKVIFTKAAGNARAADPRDLARKFIEVSGRMAQVAPNLAEALQLAQRAVGRDDLVCITGSFYLAGEAKKHFQNLSMKRGSAV